MTRYKNVPWVSASLVGINIIVFLICMFTGTSLYGLGGVHRESILVRHEYGRLFWALFLHDDTAHLSSNMIILFFLGAMLEQEVGHIWLAIIYFLSGLGGNIVSLAEKVITGSDVLSIGASGAVFGLDGLLLAMILFSGNFRNTIPPARAVLVIGLSLYSGFMQDNIDNAAHMGGLFTGFIISMVYLLAGNIRRRKYKREV